jgi:NitT/TauT family transport system ATP-binding protein
MDSTIISIQHVTKIFEHNRGAKTIALRDLSFDVRRNEFLVVIGPSGCGKSTLINLISGFDAPSSGSILLDGKPVKGPGADRVALFQRSAIFPWMTIRQNLEFGLQNSKLTRQERARRVDDIAAAVNLTGFLDAHPNTLSEGMRKLAEVGRAVLMRARILLFDEAFGDLDALTRQKMQGFIQDLWMDRPATIIFISHDLEESAYLADRIIVLSPRPGHVVADIHVDLPRPRSDDTRTSPELQDYRRELFGTLSKIKVQHFADHVR